MPSPFDMITHSPIMQLANLARAGQNPMGLIQQLSGQNAPIMQGLNLIQGKTKYNSERWRRTSPKSVVST